MLTATVDSSQLERKVRETLRIMETAEFAALKAKGEAWLDVFMRVTPKDTNRFANGFIEAARDAGITDRSPLPIVPSRRRDAYLQALAEQVAAFEKKIASDRSMMAHYQRQDASAPPRKDGKPRKQRTSQKYYKDLGRRVARHEKRLTRAKEELQKAMGSEDFVYFGVDGITQKNQNRKLSTVRTKRYGGRGTLEQTAGGLVAKLTNLEPHATIVERNPRNRHPVATAHAIVNMSGRPAALAAFNTALRASPMANRAA